MKLPLFVPHEVVILGYSRDNMITKKIVQENIVKQIIRII